MSRQRQVYPTNEIAHLWYHGAQDSARNPTGNFYFSGDTIYSYGSHFPIARKVTNSRGVAAVLFTTRSYSNTTARHISMVHRALPTHTRIFNVERPDNSPSHHSDLAGKEIEALIEKLDAVLAPKPEFTPLKKGSVEVEWPNGETEPVPALLGKRLALHKQYSCWLITHIATGLRVYTSASKDQARLVLQALDGFKVWDEVKKGKDGTPEGARLKCLKLYDAAAKKYRSVADVNRHPSAVTKLIRALEDQSEALNDFNRFFDIERSYEVPARFAPLQTIALEYETARENKIRERNARREAEWAARAEERRKEDAEFRAKLPEYCDRWRAGEYVLELENRRYGWYGNQGNLIPTMLRIKGDEIETSLGARFPLSHAKRGLALVRRVKNSGQEYRRNGHTFHLGHYPVDWIEVDGTVHAGCHVVMWEEIERIAPQLDAIQSPTLPDGSAVSEAGETA